MGLGLKPLKSRFLLAILNCFCAEAEGTQLGLVISPMMSPKMIREIGIYWKNSHLRNGDTIGLYEENPGPGSFPIFEFQPEVTHGFKKTGISADFIPTANLTFRETCLSELIQFFVPFNSYF